MPAITNFEPLDNGSTRGTLRHTLEVNAKTVPGNQRCDRCRGPCTYRKVAAESFLSRGYKSRLVKQGVHSTKIFSISAEHHVFN